MNFIGPLIALVIPVLVLTLFFKGRNQRAALAESDDDPIEGSDAEREREDRELRELPADMRQIYLETMDVQQRFSTRDGFNQDSFTSLLELLRAEGISCEIYFQPAGILGFADSFLVPQGLFELYVQRGKEAFAQRLIDKWRKT